MIQTYLKIHLVRDNEMTDTSADFTIPASSTGPFLNGHPNRTATQLRRLLDAIFTERSNYNDT